MTYSEAIDFLYNLRLFGTKMGLENTRELARRNGSPHEKLRFIHVAGTNGKGSTCAMLESIYRANGLRTGLFTSPHLISFTERIEVNRIAISEADVARLTERVMKSLGGNAESWPFHPTFFEFVTVMALLYFTEQRTDLVIWETGLGGRLDATNIVTPLASVITNIQHDHENWLGHTLEQIAMEKAGIIKPGVPVVTGVAPGPALEVIRTTAKENGSPLTTTSQSEMELPEKLPLLGEHQRANAAVALATVRVLSSKVPVTQDAINEGLQSVRWAGRLDLIRRGSRDFLLDGAHNPDGARSLASAIRQHFAGRAVTLVLGIFRDKAWQQICDELVPLCRRVLLVPVKSERSADVEELRDYCKGKWSHGEIDTRESLASGLSAASQDDFVVIAGSLHLIGEAMELLNVTAETRSERGLNEWDAGRTRPL